MSWTLLSVGGPELGHQFSGQPSAGASPGCPAPGPLADFSAVHPARRCPWSGPERTLPPGLDRTERVAILGTGDRTLEWVTPVLYLRGHDTRLFTLPAPAEDTGREGTSSARGGQPGNTTGPGAAERGPRGDRPADQAGARTPQPPPTPVPVLPSHLIRILTGHTSEVYAVAFSPDGRLLATASPDKTARVWDPATGDCLRTLTGHTAWITGVAFSPDGRMLATASYDHTARLWDPATGDCLRTLTGHTSKVTGVAFSPNGRLLATASDDKTARVWD